MNNNDNTLTNVGCSVKQCRYNSMGRRCDLEHIEIRPCKGCTGSNHPDDESFCGSYEAK